MDKFVIKISQDRSKLNQKPSSLAKAHCSINVAQSSDEENEESEGEMGTMGSTDNSDNSDKNDEVEVIPRKKKKIYTTKYSDKWEKEFKWCVKKLEQPFCKICQKNITGGKSHLKRHENLSIHKKNASKLRNVADIKTIMQNQPGNIMDKKIKIAELKLCMMAVEHNLAFLLFDHLPQLLSSLDRDSELLKSIKCSRTKATGIINEIVGPYSKCVISKILKQKKFSLIIDETTDVSDKKCLILLVRIYCSDEESSKDLFFGLAELPSSTAEDIFLKIQEIFAENQVPFNNLIGFASDNASVMMGHLSGVKARLLNLQPQLFTMGCLAHSFHLIASNACEMLPDQIETMARNVYNYFAHSAKRQSTLIEFQNFCNVKPHKLLKPSQTRWLSLNAVVDRILEQWDALILYFQHEALVENVFGAKQILLDLQSIIYKIYFTFLSHILKIITKINKEFQSEHARIHKILPIVKSNFKMILKYFINAKICDDEPLTVIDFNNPKNFLSLNKIYIGAQSEIILLENSDKLAVQDIEVLKTNCRKFYIKLCNEIKSRINLEDETLNLISNVCNLDNIFSNNQPSLMRLAIKFPNFVTNNDFETLNQEYRLLREYKPGETLSTLEELISYLYKQKDGLNMLIFSNLIIFLECIVSLPHGSASAERKFSAFKLTKTNIRNKLNVDTCENILLAKELLGKNTCHSWSPTEELLHFKKKV